MTAEELANGVRLYTDDPPPRDAAVQNCAWAVPSSEALKVVASEAGNRIVEVNPAFALTSRYPYSLVLSASLKGSPRETNKL